jgi:hypothetical protein
MERAWVESVNTMLDDIGFLCLSNGKRVPMPSLNSFNVLFEVDNLRGVSPATISRCGIVLMDPIGLNWQALMSSWIDHWPNTSPITTFVKSLCNYLLPPCLQMALKYLQPPMPQTGLLLNFFKLVDAMLNVACICYKTIGCESKKFYIFPNVHHDITTNMENDLLINLANLSKTNMQSKNTWDHNISNILESQELIRDVRYVINWRHLHIQKSVQCDTSGKILKDLPISRISKEDAQNIHD